MMSDSEASSADKGSENNGITSALKVVAAIGTMAIIWSIYHFSMGGPEVRRMIDIEMLISDGHYDQAIDATTRMIEQTPTWEWAYTTRGEAYRRMGQPDRAIPDFDEAIRLKSDSEAAFYDRCLAFHDKGEIDRAIADCDEAGRIKPELRSYEAIAAMLFAAGKFDLAYERLGMLIDLRPDLDLPAPRFYRGQIALIVYDHPADAADDFAKAADSALDQYGLTSDLAGNLDAGTNNNSSRNTIPLAFDFVPDGLYLIIWNHIARVRAAQDDAKELAEHLEKLRAPVWRKLFAENPIGNIADEVERKVLVPWPGAILALFLGKTTPEVVRAAAQGEADPDVRRKRMCDADFYLAEYHLGKGETDDARKLFQAAAEGCPDSAREAGFAKSEFKRIKS
jgi:tetratricopeptide (TPR) repeat protein